MTKLFLLQSKSEKEDAGDVIIDLDKSIFFKLIKCKDFFKLAIEYTNSDIAIATFDKLVHAKGTLKNILSHLDQDVSLAEKIVPIDQVDKRKEKFAEALKDMLDR